SIPGVEHPEVSISPPKEFLRSRKLAGALPKSAKCPNLIPVFVEDPDHPVQAVENDHGAVIRDLEIGDPSEGHLSLSVTRLKQSQRRHGPLRDLYGGVRGPVSTSDQKSADDAAEEERGPPKCHPDRCWAEHRICEHGVPPVLGVTTKRLK